MQRAMSSRLTEGAADLTQFLLGLEEYQHELYCLSFSLAVLLLALYWVAH